MITNIKDNRKNDTKSEGLDFVLEPSYTDNDLPEATQYSQDDPKTNIFYAEMLTATIAEAIAWGNSFECPVTLFIYDQLHDEKMPHRITVIDDTVPIFGD